MHISISGQQLDVGGALETHVQDALERIIGKYFTQAVDAKVVFSRESHLFKTEILVNEGTGKRKPIKAVGEATDIYPSFDITADRIEKQLRRYKRRLKNHHKSVETILDGDAIEATAYVINPESQESEQDNPLIIAEKSTAIETLSVKEAVMRMNLAKVQALMFINEKTGNMNIVYQREDGNVSWVDAEESVA